MVLLNFASSVETKQVADIMALKVARDVKVFSKDQLENKINSMLGIFVGDLKIVPSQNSTVTDASTAD